MEVLDSDIFNQLLLMDEDDPSFVRGIVQNYVSQVKETNVEMAEAYRSGDLDAVSKLGHFLKGSSGNMGAAQLQEICNDIQCGLDPGRLIGEIEPALKRYEAETSKILSGL